MKIKICGITNKEDALYCAEKGVDALGFIFYEKSKRSISPQRAYEIIASLPPFVNAVGVFVNESIEKVKEIARYCNLDYLQFHGNESPRYLEAFEEFKVIKVIRVKDEGSIKVMENYSNVSVFLVDTYDENLLGGTGKTFNWDLALKAKEYGKIILSGGLNPDNVADAINSVNPYAVDVASGVESIPGKKDFDKVEKYIYEAKKAFLNQY
ncbi:MAG: phosphoribosylanthranilate isomerase [Candidatus Schekmanbacteria bacterium]|nr:MAG: phosphoribosylanthranilate isomerase [Candidatus Schekmanbacteria bacterium]